MSKTVNVSEDELEAVIRQSTGDWISDLDTLLSNLDSGVYDQE